MTTRLTAAAVAAADRLLRSRPLVRAPIALYRVGLGALLGHRMLVLGHTGRRSGRPREVVLEVVDRPGPDRYVVVSGFGTRSQWFRNVTADPRVRVTVGRRSSRPATARVLPTDGATRALGRYAEHHPRAWARFRPVLERTLGRPVTPEEPPPMVELRVEGG